MPLSPNDTDPATADKEVPAVIDPSARLLCYFTIHIWGDTFFNLQIYTRKWYNFSENQDTIALLPGRLGRLPPELRFMIYDYVMPANSNHFDYSGTSARCWLPTPRRKFAVPEIAHVCRDMRQYAMSKYQFVWYSYTSEAKGAKPVRIHSFMPKRPLTRNEEEIRALRRPHRSEFGFGFFDPKKDSVEIHLSQVEAVEVVYDSTLEWDNPLQEPTLMDVSTRVRWYPSKEMETKRVFSLKGTEIWQILWKNAWVRNRKHHIVV
ncbi:hypothetical protein F5Y10DRAFT_286312 [Nemania abortiva]|nr:hypothetical protein F5Y10DRAFT_286312 [Nemania abortiva]